MNYTPQQVYDKLMEPSSNGLPDEYLNAFVMHYKRVVTLVKNARKKTESAKGRRYTYLLTFTIRKEHVDTKSLRDEILAYISKQFLRKPLNVLKAHIVEEDTKAGRPHWHVSVETSKGLKLDRFNYYKQKYGYVHRTEASKHNNYESALNYLAKTGNPTKITG